MQTKPYYFQMAVKSVEQQKSGSVIIEGSASTPDLDRYRDIVEPDAFKSALEMYMKNPVILRSHNADVPAGHALSTTITDKGLRVRAEITHEQTIKDITDENMRALSIGYLAKDSVLQHEDGTPFNAEEDSVWDPKLVRVIKEIDLVEISIVTTPANGNALFTIEKSVKAVFNDLICKSFNLTKDNMDLNKKDQENVEDEKKDEAVEDEEVNDEKAAEGENEESNEADGAEAPKAEEAGNSDEESEADDAEGESKEKSEDEAEEADADAKPQDEEESDEESEDEGEGEKAMILDAKDMEAMTILKSVGLVREAKEGETAHALSPEAKNIIEQADNALVMAQKAIGELEAKLDEHSEKAPLAYHAQLDHEKVGGEDKGVGRREVSSAFKGLFGTNR